MNNYINHRFRSPENYPGASASGFCCNSGLCLLFLIGFLCGFLFGGFFGVADKLEQHELSAIAETTLLELDNAGVTAGTIQITRADFRKELADDGALPDVVAVFLGDDGAVIEQGNRAAACRQVALAGQGDELFGKAFDFLGLF